MVGAVADVVATAYNVPGQGHLWFVTSRMVVVPYLFTLPLVPSIYVDKRRVSRESAWDPSKLYYLGVVPHPLTALVLFVYVFKRYRAL